MLRLSFLIIVIWASSAPAQVALDGVAGELRVLDKVTGEVSDLDLQVGQSEQVGRLNITLEDCRVPRVNPTGDAYARITVYYSDNISPAFEGWLIASAPALHAMDHPRYDVWALRCRTS